MSPSDFTALMPECCTDVLDSMYFTTVFDTDASDTLLPPEKESFDFTLQFQGDLSGTFGLRVEVAAARGIAANFLGEDEGAITSSESAEVMGELANMLCGSIVSRLQTPRKFILSHPEQAPESSPVVRPEVLHLDTDYGQITTWVVHHQAAGSA